MSQPYGNNGPSPWGSPPPSAPWGAPPPQPKSNALKFVGLGCLAIMVLTCAGGGVAALLLRGAVRNLGPGREVGSALVSPGTPYTLTYVTRSGDDSGVWLDLDLGYTQGLQLTGPLAVRVNGTVIAQYNVNLTSGSCSAPVRDSNTSFCIGWRSTEMNGNGSLSGQTRMFKVPAQPRGATVTVSGMIFASQGVQVRRLRIYGAE